MSSPSSRRMHKEAVVHIHHGILLSHCCFNLQLSQIVSYIFLFLFPPFFPFAYISWRLITLQYCSGFWHTLIWISHGFTCVPHPEPPSQLPPHPIPSLWVTNPEHLSHASNLDWRSISQLKIYVFQCYSLRSSVPCLLPQSPKVCSIHLWLFFCLAYRVIITVFLNSIYMC